MIWSVNECVRVLTCLLPYSADIFEMAELVTRVVDIPSSRALGKDARTGAHALANHGLQPHTPRLQPYVSQATTVCFPGCNPMYLQARTSASTTASRLTSTHCAQNSNPQSSPYSPRLQPQPSP